MSKNNWNRYRSFDTAKGYAKGQYLVDLEEKLQTVRLFHAGNAKVTVTLTTTIQPNEAALRYPIYGKVWKWPFTLGGPSAPGLFKPATKAIAIEHDDTLCPSSGTHQIHVDSEYDRGDYREKLYERGEFIFDC
ncbi:hypothetical protein [Arthrobacter sp. W4I7]|uniref:hypothetical protein n=1 Tax=Arthrobacter sp. W4I7 TaxID=3042296 RepID=UPI0027861FF1|nr:hypothetical protein [Arthrobacter sp. W4I7]MDQ0692139.1 hypothetical protein [Arthrobacter sp. W4I7]